MKHFDRYQSGFTLVELMAAMVASAILILGFSTVLIFARKELSNTATRVALGQDQVLIDRYVRTKLTATISDSMKIFPSTYAESIDSAASSGIILRAVDSDSTIYHISVSSGALVWMEDSVSHSPVDASIHNLNFSERIISTGKNLTISMDLCSSSDTLEARWSITLRN